ncbi:MAG: hypothetical protein LBP38_08205 [Desulfovibrio sp.]|nr:hypothetical protein [Desulfovibrio sp.]
MLERLLSGSSVGPSGDARVGPAEERCDRPQTGAEFNGERGARFSDGQRASGNPGGSGEAEAAAREFARLAVAWEESLDDDLNTAAALGHVNSLLHLVQRVADDKSLNACAAMRQLPARAAALLPAWQAVFGIFLLPPRQFLEDLKHLRAARRRIDVTQVETMLRERAEARTRKDFAAADRLRAALADLGVEVRDSAQGSEWDVP